MNRFLNRFRAPVCALLLLAAPGLFRAAGAEEADGAARENSGALEPAAESLLPKHLFSGRGLFGRLSERVRFSGFAHLVGGYLDDGGAIYQGYDNAISFGQHSLFALQTDVALIETLSFTTQLLAHASATRDSGVEWAYLTWRPSKRWRFKAGKMRTPFYLHSDTIDVSYTYPWIIPPQQVYTPYVPNDFTGLSAAYQFNIGAFDLEAKAYWGNFEGAITVEDEFPVDAEADNLWGLILEAWRGNLHLRASWHRAGADFKLPRTARFAALLRRFGFNSSADSLDTKTDVTYAQAGVSYETLDYFLKAEYTRLRKTDSFAFPQYDSYYLSGGYTFHPFNLPITAHATFASFRTQGGRRPVEEIPRGVSPRLDFLRGAYIRAFNSVLDDDLQSLSVGLRWDVNLAVALKAEWVRLRADREQRGFFTIDPTADFDRKANLFLLGLEWVF